MFDIPFIYDERQKEMNGRPKQTKQKEYHIIRTRRSIHAT